MTEGRAIRRRRGRPRFDEALLAIDLFSGLGGLTLGLKRAGFRVIGAVERDALAVESYALNHRGTRVWPTDIAEVDPLEVLGALSLEPGRLDLLAACPPCQGFSAIRTLNRQLAVADDRNDLLFAILPFLRALRPKTLMMENVPGLSTDKRFRTFQECLDALGYCMTLGVLNAAEFGVPQRRRRLILLASLLGSVTHAPPARRRYTVRHAIGRMPSPGTSGDAAHDLREVRSERILQLIRSIPKDGGGRAALGDDNQLKCHRRVDGFRDVYGRMAWDDVAPTITGGCINPSKGRFLHPDEDRAITLREAALLQSFPPDYQISLRRGKYAAAEMIGNALPPRFIAHQARGLGEHIWTHRATNGENGG
ncbi:MAG: DNA cytosine methyltransferase [Gemmatimonadetes bacterium]|nr:DNA cytosine methyltransferase [Gemmatimonadota bacterium]